jgi:hypothetical protein
MVIQKNIIHAGLALIALYVLWGLPMNSFIVVAVLATLVYITTNVVAFGLATAIIIGYFLKIGMPPMTIVAEKMTVNRAYENEGFQERTPEAVQERIRVNQQSGPLHPKVEKITGVLESPDILDNVQLNPAQELTYDAQPGASIPASARARVIINPPSEGFVPAPKGSQDKPPKENPYLQDGEDYESVEAALISKGTDLPMPEVPANEMASASIGSAPAF